ncbi:uncharacterized protein LOC131237230 [Magnolia sinica]|uniref:uncharacterized protein LOC131237230 n=1 Tax=Magnolia sinica TaxID=86752 RepID=UPI0026595433|nr:uncharacterized protein LOC131237230 [Magnolia sinica]
MGSSGSGSGDESKPSILYDSSPSHPLLSKPSQTDPHHPIEESESNPYPLITFNYGPRHFQDLPFLFLFLLFSLSTFAFGIFSIAHRNPYSSHISSFIYDHNTTSCIHKSSVSPLAIFQLPSFSSYSSSSSSSPLIKDLTWTLVITFILSGPFIFCLLWSLRHYTKQIVYASLPFFIIIPVFINVFWFVACTVTPTCRDSFSLAYRILILVFVFLIIVIIAWIIFANWHRIELTIRIVGVASDALARNIGLLGVLPCLSFGIIVYFVPIVVFLVFARLNGKIVPKASGETEYDCVWKQDSWVPAYFTLAIVTMLWSAAVMVEAQVYVISGTVAQWYFLKEGSTPSRSIRSSLRNAFGHSFGTVCFSGLLIGAVRVVRAAVDSAEREDAASGIVNLILRCCVNVLLSAINFLNKFTINFAAITGEGYCSSAKMTYELLRRNLLSAVFVETVSTRILVGIIFVLSALYAIVVCAILKAVSSLGVEAYFVAVLAWMLLLAALGYFVHVLENVIDTVYVCYAIDRDKGEVCKQEVHEVYVHLPISRNDRLSHALRTPLIV